WSSDVCSSDLNSERRNNRHSVAYSIDKLSQLISSNRFTEITDSCCSFINTRRDSLTHTISQRPGSIFEITQHIRDRVTDLYKSTTTVRIYQRSSEDFTDTSVNAFKPI